ncbi:MAG TPA: DUF6268 family outer membrane beta-barrel protein [Chthoniobacterales bacterium]|nr:DUF6268 family outer membrane beta-barrel protein [Chthoniobacterales bacterium]
MRFPSKSVGRLTFLLIWSIALSVHAGSHDEVAAATETTAPSAFPFSYEFDASETYVGDGDVTRGSRDIRDFDENDALVRLVLTPRVRIGILRLGAAYERYDFGMSDFAQLPDTLQSANLIIGLDTEFSDAFLIRIEAHPGFYGAGDLESGDFHVPFIVGGTYIYSPSLQFIFGVGVDFESKYPALPGGGIRWKISPQWTLDAVLPTPRLEFSAARNWTIYAGAEIKSGTYRVDDSFGDLRRPVRLNGAVLSYSEIRTGLGVELKISDAVKLNAEAGYQPYRSFDYYRADIRYREDGGAPYGTVAFHAAF